MILSALRLPLGHSLKLYKVIHKKKKKKKKNVSNVLINPVLPRGLVAPRSKPMVQLSVANFHFVKPGLIKHVLLV